VAFAALSRCRDRRGGADHTDEQSSLFGYRHCSLLFDRRCINAHDVCCVPFASHVMMRWNGFVGWWLCCDRRKPESFSSSDRLYAAAIGGMLRR
jgi:hypothetical protein